MRSSVIYLSQYLSRFKENLIKKPLCHFRTNAPKRFWFFGFSSYKEGGKMKLFFGVYQFLW